jgi:hypothetical protein
MAGNLSLSVGILLSLFAAARALANTSSPVIRASTFVQD